MPRWIEFHDSTVEEVRAEPTEVAVRLRAYVHDWTLVGGQWRGSGWSQLVVLRLRGAAICREPAVPVGISSGTARVGATTHDNLIPVPLASAEHTKLWLELVTAETLEIEGDGLDIEVIGEVRFVEDLPDELKPFNS